ncbi:hypothetical protein LRI_0254 [Limosilactobacillus reuteri I5007]|uniref:Uncharacterized protein n=2 Tax=Limosilactobacillus reuteri TaxID=1598 RepID=A0A0U5CVP5_LIMRT|nr:hypothetical protein LRI_0254 [Limosilactobacillus reuteri I5007]CUR37317.1 hypothetical protein LRLP16767_LRPG3B_01111 [Limosilactobacillus reuteri]
MNSLATACKFFYDGGVNKNHERHVLIYRPYLFIVIKV